MKAYALPAIDFIASNMPENPQQPAVNGDRGEAAVAGNAANGEILDQVRRQEDLTLTDHVNRRLLASFLSRINSSATSVQESESNVPNGNSAVNDDNDDFAA